MKLSQLTAIFLNMAVSAAILAGCVSKTPLAGDQKSYAGKWEAGDGTWVQFYFDGGGDMKNSNTEITGGAATFKGDTVTIGMGPISKSFHVDQSPQENNGKWILVLDGVTYTKAGSVSADVDNGAAKSSIEGKSEQNPSRANAEGATGKGNDVNTEDSNKADAGNARADQPSSDEESATTKTLPKPDPIPLDVKN